MDYSELITKRNEDSKFAKFMGALVTDIREGEATAVMSVPEHMRNGIGAIHGACIYAVADMSAGAAAHSWGKVATTMDFSFHYLRPALNEVTELVAKATTIKHGKRVVVINVEVTDQTGKALATGISSFIPIDIDR